MSMQNMKKARWPVSLLPATLCAAATLFAAGAATAQDTRPVAFTNARILTIAGDAIERGTIVVRDGKIEAVGADVTVPAGARVVDATGKTIMPGLVSAWSRAGFNQQQTRSNTPTRGSRRGRPRSRNNAASGRTSNSAATKVVDGLYARQEVFGELLEEGVTSLALNPAGYGFPGLGAVLDPSGETRSELTVDDDAFVQIGMMRNGNTKKLLSETFDKAKKVKEEREKPKEAPKPAEPKKPEEQKKPEGEAGKEQPKQGEKPGEKPQPKPGEQPKPSEQPKQDPKPAQDPKEKPKEEPKKQPEKPKDPNLEVLADLLQGKRRAILQINSAADMLHWLDAVGDDVEFPRAVAVQAHDTYSGTVDLVLDTLKEWQCPVLLPPRLSTKDRTQYLTNPARTLHDAGIEIGFVVGDTPTSIRGLFFQLMDLVRSGLPADVALRAVTLVPAKALGIDKRTGSLEAGKDADLLVFDGDPLTPTGRLEQVWLRGRRVER